MQPITASLDPDDFRHVAAPSPAGYIQISQVDHGMQVRALTALHIPCACGRPLCGIETEVIDDPKGYALFFKGVCLSCGVQSGIYMSEPRLQALDDEARRGAQLKADVTAVLARVAQLREDEQQQTPIALHAVRQEEVA